MKKSRSQIRIKRSRKNTLLRRKEKRKRKRRINNNLMQKLIYFTNLNL